MLKNRIYRGEIVHKGKPSQARHAAIIDEELWVRVQRHLEDNRVERRNGPEDKEQNPLPESVGRRFLSMTPVRVHEKENAIPLLCLSQPNHRNRCGTILTVSGFRRQIFHACPKPPCDPSLPIRSEIPECDLEEPP